MLLSKFCAKALRAAASAGRRMGLDNRRNFAGAKFGGEGEIRTHETLASLPVFKTGALDHSATSPLEGLKIGKNAAGDHA